MVQEVHRANGVGMRTTRCPIRIDGSVLKSERGAPRLGENTQQLIHEFSLPE
jgi:crotonobetainyl-CoA:carnitine CoA-transferase CaiB-like acyl-CoA transferase